METERILLRPWLDSDAETLARKHSALIWKSAQTAL